MSFHEKSSRKLLTITPLNRWNINFYYIIIKGNLKYHLFSLYESSKVTMVQNYVKFKNSSIDFFSSKRRNKGSVFQEVDMSGEIYFRNSSKYYLKSSLNKLRIALHSILRKDFIVFSKSQNHLGTPANFRIDKWMGNWVFMGNSKIVRNLAKSL